MRILLLGGTRFLGRHIAEQALAAGHDLTLLHRGRSGPGLFPQARHLIADRDQDLSLLRGPGGGWDVAIDTNAYVPRQVRAVAAALSAQVERYHLVSSISVYADLQTPGATEDSACVVLPDPAAEEVSGATYGGLKKLCEEAALDGFGASRTLVSRPGLIVGPHDPTERFTWWVRRLQRGGDVLVPGPRSAALQFVDVRDLAAWHLLQAQQRTAGVFNLTGPNTALTRGEWFAQAQTALNPGARLHWADEAWLLQQGVAPWTELPLWVPPESAGLLAANTARAQATGFVSRPLAATLRDTALWAASNPPPPADGAMARPAVGLAPDKEAGLLAGLVASAL